MIERWFAEAREPWRNHPTVTQGIRQQMLSGWRRQAGDEADWYPELDAMVRGGDRVEEEMANVSFHMEGYEWGGKTYRMWENVR